MITTEQYLGGLSIFDHIFFCVSIILTLETCRTIEKYLFFYINSSRNNSYLLLDLFQILPLSVYIFTCFFDFIAMNIYFDLKHFVNFIL